MGKDLMNIENLKKVYKAKKKEITAIEKINLKIEEKDIFGIIGLSGAGKSTLIRCMNFLEKPTEGKIYYKGIDLSTLKNKELRKIRQEIGMIFQGFHLLEQRTVLKNVLFPLEIAKQEKSQALNRAKELLKLVGLEDKMEAYPYELSGGQKQRVAIARALANNPSMLLCDEATSALDPNTTNSILDLLKSINERYGITIVLITHEMHVIESICNKVAIIDQSQIQEMGTVVDVFENPKTKIAKSFLFPYSKSVDRNFGTVFLRLQFDENVFEPVLANLILETKIKLNIIEANLRKSQERIQGTMVVQLPEDPPKIAKVKHYLQTHHILYEEEKLS